jgi:hypothetical protein
VVVVRGLSLIWYQEKRTKGRQWVEGEKAALCMDCDIAGLARNNDHLCTLAGESEVDERHMACVTNNLLSMYTAKTHTR